MLEVETSPPTESESSLYFGAAAAAVVALLPYVNVLVVPAYVVGAMAAAWHAAGHGRSLSFKAGAKLGFLSPFVSCLLAAIVADLIWAFFGYQLWQRQNLMLSLIRVRLMW